MNPIRNLTTRLSIALLIVMAFSSILFSSIFYTAYKKMEHKMIDVLVGYATYDVNHRHNADVHLGEKDQLEFISVYNSKDNKPPQIFHRYSPGFYHDIQFDDRKYHLGVIQTGNRVEYITFDITQIENEEERVGLLVLTASLFTIIISLILIQWLSKDVIKPVKSLAHEVSNIDVNQRNVRLADKFKDVEVSIIAKSFDHYLDRVDQFIEREQSFTSTASHELRTPLFIISTSAELLQEKVTIPDDSQHYLNNIRRNSQDMSEIITALLFLSREASKTASTDIVDNTNIKEIVYRTIEDITLDENTKHADITVTTADDSHANALYSHIYLVVKNIVTNAVKYSDNKPITISISKQVLTVRDNGIGIASEEYSDLYKRGVKGCNSEGNGLGLFIVKSFCDYYQWQIDIQSSTQDKLGTTVMVDFSTNSA